MFPSAGARAAGGLARYASQSAGGAAAGAVGVGAVGGIRRRGPPWPLGGPAAGSWTGSSTLHPENKINTFKIYSVPLRR